MTILTLLKEICPHHFSLLLESPLLSTTFVITQMGSKLEELGALLLLECYLIMEQIVWQLLLTISWSLVFAKWVKTTWQCSGYSLRRCLSIISHSSIITWVSWFCLRWMEWTKEVGFTSYAVSSFPKLGSSLCAKKLTSHWLDQENLSTSFCTEGLLSLELRLLPTFTAL